MMTGEILELFDEHMAQKGLRLDAVVIGGTALNLLGIVSRYTKDCDILYPQISKEVAEAAAAGTRTRTSRRTTPR